MRNQVLNFRFAEDPCWTCGDMVQYNAAKVEWRTKPRQCKACIEAESVAEQFGDTETGRQWLALERPDVVRQLERMAQHEEERKIQFAAVKEAFEEAKKEGSLVTISSYPPDAERTPED